MMPDLTVLLELAALGLCIGFLAGLLGIGGGAVMVPFLIWLLEKRGVPFELAIKMAIATSMATIAFTSLSSVRAHHQRGAVRWDLVKTMSPGIIAGSLLGSLSIFAWLNGQILTVVFALFVSFSATQMLIDTKPKPSRQIPGWAGQFGAGSVIGLVSGLVGAGGAFISVPFMTWCNVAIHHAVATSAALGFPIALANVAGYVVSGLSLQQLPADAIGYLWLPALVVISSCSVLMAPLGAATAHRMPMRPLRRLFACQLYLLAGLMLYKGLAS